jgi:hypothetical protein
MRNVLNADYTLLVAMFIPVSENNYISAYIIIRNIFFQQGHNR